MPIYEYHCTVCSYRFELRQGFQDPAVADCPQCRASAQRVIHPVGVVFKGSGWYSTDHRGSSSSTARGNGSKTAEDHESGAGAEVPESTDTSATAESKTGE